MKSKSEQEVPQKTKINRLQEKCNRKLQQPSYPIATFQLVK